MTKSCPVEKILTPTHLFNCNRFITFRSKVHDAVRDQIYCMAKSYRIESFLEPVLSKLVDVIEKSTFGGSRGDLLVPGIDGSTIIIDVRSSDVCNDVNLKLANSNLSDPLSEAENQKFAKYLTKINCLNSLSHTNYLLCPFVFSLFGSLGKVALSFLHDFAEIVEKRTGRIFDVRFWTNRIVFAIFKGMVSLVSNSHLSLGKYYEERVVEFTSSHDLAFDDVLC
ncbi:hypothetical protein RCL1_007058 [Eukaryota sp. TZLM3-RCL]